TAVWSGPYCTKILADFGAEVIKVESAKRPDSQRGVPDPPPGSGVYPGRDSGPKPWNRAGYFNNMNTGKLGLTLDLTRPEGVAIFKRLAKVSDVVIDNFRATVMERFGLGYADLRDVDPSIIVVAMSAHGMSGPERNYGGYGASLEQLTGISWLNGYNQEGAPYRGGVNYPDPVASLHGVGAILAALRSRRRTGKGQFIDLSQRESAICIVGESVLDFSMNGRVGERMGNRHRSMAPHGCYRCRGVDSWVTIAVASDDQWQRFATAIGSPAWTKDERFRNGLGRLENYINLDRLVEQWTLERDHIDVMHLLQSAGVPAAAVYNNVEQIDDPHLTGRGFYEWVTHPEAGTHRYQGVPVKLSRTPGGIQRPSPCLGQHNDYVLRDLLGLSARETRDLHDKGVTNNDPRSVGSPEDG
ncbi:MAG: CoA transferase, partial [Dehalococcoidia bacterium]|nr:CoA transferase [Dehalococcoidia bacterium]